MTNPLHLYQVLLILVPSASTTVRSASWGRFFSRSLWTEPMDHFILEESPSAPPPPHHSHAGIIQLTPIQFIPTSTKSRGGQSSQRASSRIAPPSEFSLDSSDIYYTIANYSAPINNGGQSQSMNNGQQQSQQQSDASNGGSHSLDKTLLDLLMATNASIPSLSSEKYFWISAHHSNPNNRNIFETNNGNGNSNTNINNNFGGKLMNLEEVNDSLNLMHNSNNGQQMKNDIVQTSSNDEDGEQDGRQSSEDNLPHTKVVSLCDKTLALLDWIGKDPSTAHLSKCELFDLEKSPELAYTEAKKTGIPIQNVSFREMRDIINACRVLAESDTIQNGQSVYQVSSSTTSNGNSDSFSSSANYPSSSFPVGQSSVGINNGMKVQNMINGTKPTVPSVTSTTTSSADKSFLWNSWRGIFPGTKWCGLGDSAKNYFDLGKRRDVDVCCRAHDHCPIRLKALRMGYGLINLSLYTKSHCDCDEDFMRCLRQANSKSAERLGNFYFNIMKVQCIKEEKSFMCAKYIKNKDGKDECVRIEEDKNATKMVFSQPETTYR